MTINDECMLFHTQMIQNRLEKNSKKLQAWSEKNQIEAYRVYDRDIPEYPFILDRYKDSFVIYDKSQKIDEEKNHLPLMIEATKHVFLECRQKNYY